MLRLLEHGMFVWLDGLVFGRVRSWRALGRGGRVHEVLGARAILVADDHIAAATVVVVVVRWRCTYVRYLNAVEVPLWQDRCTRCIVPRSRRLIEFKLSARKNERRCKRQMWCMYTIERKLGNVAYLQTTGRDQLETSWSSRVSSSALRRSERQDSTAGICTPCTWDTDSQLVP